MSLTSKDLGMVLGCVVQHRETCYVGLLQEVCNNKPTAIVVVDGFSKLWRVEDIVPIMRKDLTKEEGTKYYRIKNGDGKNQRRMDADAIIYLIHQGVDVFDWISQGDAFERLADHAS